MSEAIWSDEIAGLVLSHGVMDGRISMLWYMVAVSFDLSLVSRMSASV